MSHHLYFILWTSVHIFSYVYVRICVIIKFVYIYIQNTCKSPAYVWVQLRGCEQYNVYKKEFWICICKEMFHIPIEPMNMTTCSYVLQTTPLHNTSPNTHALSCFTVGWNQFIRINSSYSWGAFYWHGLTLIPAWISGYLNCKVWGDITCPFPREFGNG